MRKKKLRTEFAILMYNGIYVDYDMLDLDICVTSFPKLFRKNASIEGLILDEKDRAAENWIARIENLKRCSLVPITITIEP